jgi:hypothetical protein
VEIIHQPLEDIRRYGGTVAWLFDLGDSIFGKDIQTNAEGLLWFRATNGIESVIPRNSQALAANLEPGIYEFRLDPDQFAMTSGSNGFKMTKTRVNRVNGRVSACPDTGRLQDRSLRRKATSASPSLLKS